MNDDYLINLLPSEYLPKPEFKLFPVYVLVLLVITGMIIFTNWMALNNELENVKSARVDEKSHVDRRTPMALEALDVQARSRMLFSYAVTIWAMLHQNPPWVDVYNEIEESLPDGMWIDTLQMVGGGERRWPSYVLSGLVAGNEYGTVLMYYEQMLAPESKFDRVSLSGYNFTQYKGHDVVSFEMRFSLKQTAFMGF